MQPNMQFYLIQHAKMHKKRRQFPYCNRESLKESHFDSKGIFAVRKMNSHIAIFHEDFLYKKEFAQFPKQQLIFRCLEALKTKHFEEIDYVKYPLLTVSWHFDKASCHTLAIPLMY